MSTNLYGESNTPQELYNFYKILKASKEYKRLLDTIDKLCSRYNRAECYALKGDLYMKLLQFENAYDSYRKAINCNSDNAAYYAVLGRAYLYGGRFYEAIDTLSYLIEHKNLSNYTYYVSYREHRLIAACCVADWELAKEDINYIPDNFVFYTKPIDRVITKELLIESIKNKKIIVEK